MTENFHKKMSIPEWDLNGSFSFFSKNSPFDTEPLLKFENHHRNYGDDLRKQKRAFRILADHTRSATFMIADGVLPGNEGRNMFFVELLTLFVKEKLGVQENFSHVSPRPSFQNTANTTRNWSK